MIKIAVFVALGLLTAAGFSEPAAAQTVQFDLGQEPAPFTARLFQIMAGVTLLSLAPWLLITVTGFVRIVVVLSLLRSALGLQQTPPNMVVISLALFLTAFVMVPTLDKAWSEGVGPMLENEITQAQGIERTVRPFRTFMMAEVRPADLDLFESLAARNRQVPAQGTPAAPSPIESAFDRLDTGRAESEPPLGVLAPAFLISELRRAFEIGFLVFMPFLIIDIVVAAILMAMGMMMLPPAIVALPFKIIFFVTIDGWHMIAGNLVQSFAGG